ncbi:MAG TPA: putative baseplate assembly protein [Verrucomicrobiota bacterium]|nr:putative baseplate assembly protein [Verrucomicrobiota bacterium]
MPLRPPILDDRRYDDLVAELVARIPAHTPEWTHPRPGDPGRTLIELFAWLGDALLYRVNLIPERQRLAFLRLLGQPLRPARPARGLVTLSLKETAPTAALTLAPPARFTGPGEVPFESRTDMMVLPVTGECWVKRPAEIDASLRNALATFHRGQFLANESGDIAPYLAEPLFADGQPDETGFDVVTHSADRCLWLALLAPKAGDPGSAEQLGKNDTVQKILGGEQTAGRALLNLGFVPALPAGDPLEPATARARVPHVWEATTQIVQRTTDLEHAWTPEYLRLDEVSDTTAGLTRPGVIRVALPAGRALYAPPNDVRVDPTAGVGDRPPRLDDEAVAGRLVGWIRLRPAPATAPPPAAVTQFGVQTSGVAQEFASPTVGLPATTMTNEVAHLPITWLGINAVEVEQLTAIENVILGVSTGGPDQEFSLPAGSVEPDSLQLEVEEGGTWRRWQRVEDLLTISSDPQVARDTPAFTLDSEAGTVRFGDDVFGRIPPFEARVRAGRFRYGGGVAGNLPADTLKTVSATTLNGARVGDQLDLQQPLPLTGGAASETLAEAEKRIPTRLRHQERAVTSDDYAAVARSTPGVAVGRVELLPRFKPQQRFFNVPGVVSVMALPDRPFAPAPNPRADRPFLEAIHGWLDARRPLGTELYVIGCDYVPIAVSVAVTIRDGHDPETTLQAVKEALRRVLWPLAGGGFDGRGWALGRELSNRELAVEVARLPGVSEVAGLNLFTRRELAVVGAIEWVSVGDSATGREQNVPLEPFQLPELLRVHAVADDTLSGAPLDLGDSSNPHAAANAVGVPVVPKLC